MSAIRNLPRYQRATGSTRYRLFSCTGKWYNQAAFEPIQRSGQHGSCLGVNWELFAYPCIVIQTSNPVYHSRLTSWQVAERGTIGLCIKRLLHGIPTINVTLGCCSVWRRIAHPLGPIPDSCWFSLVLRTPVSYSQGLK